MLIQWEFSFPKIESRTQETLGFPKKSIKVIIKFSYINMSHQYPFIPFLSEFIHFPYQCGIKDILYFITLLN
jgi:hypothetical protein